MREEEQPQPGSSRHHGNIAHERALDFSKRSRNEKACLIAALASLSTALMFLEIPIVPPLKYDPSDVAAVLAGISVGPLAGLGTIALRGLMSAMLHADPFGVFVQTVAGAAFVLPASVLYWMRRGRTGLATGLLAGCISMVLVMGVVNVVAAPLWFGKPLAALMPFILWTVTPFNIVKSLLNSAIAFGLIARLSGPPAPRPAP